MPRIKSAANVASEHSPLSPRSWRAANALLATLPALRITYQSCFAALSAIAAPSAGTLQNLCTFLVRVPALGAAMVESAVSRLTRAR